MSTSRRGFGETLIDALVALSGLAILLLTGYVHSNLLINVLQALGTSLVAGGIITFLMRKIHSDDSSTVDQVQIAAPNRLDLENEYVRRKYSAHKVDILSIA